MATSETKANKKTSAKATIKRLRTKANSTPSDDTVATDASTISVLRELKAQMTEMQRAMSENDQQEELERLRTENAQLRRENKTLRAKLTTAENALRVAQQPKTVGQHDLASFEATLRLASAHCDEVESEMLLPAAARTQLSMTNRTSNIDDDDDCATFGATLSQPLELSTSALKSDIGAATDRTSTIVTMLEEMRNTEAYTTTLLLATLEDRIYLDRPENLYTLWRALGGAQGFSRCRSRPNVLAYLLRSHKCATLTLKPKKTTSHDDCLVVPEEEIVGFTSCFVSQLPLLRSLVVSGYSVWPIDRKLLSSHATPFLRMETLSVLGTPWHPRMLVNRVNDLRHFCQTALRKLSVSKKLGPASCDTKQLLAHFDGILELV